MESREGARFGVSLYAGVAQLAEHDVANVVVVGSNPITRSFPLLESLLKAGAPPGGPGGFACVMAGK